MGKPMWRIAGKELKSVFTERTILLAVVVQVFVAGFSGFLVVGLSALVNPDALPVGTEVRVAVVDVDADLVDAMKAEGVLVVTPPHTADALTLFDKGSVDAVILGNASADALPRAVNVILPEGDFHATFTLTRLKAALENYERDLRVENAERLRGDPLYVETSGDGGSFAFVYGLLMPLLVFLPVVLAGALTADSVTEEVQRGTLPLLLVTPATPADVVEGKLLANVATAPLLAAVWFLLLGINGLTVPFTGALAILVLATAVSVILGLLACAIAFATKDRNKAHVTYATMLMLLMVVSLALPVSPVNAVARLAAGSAGVESLLVVAGSVLVAAAGWVALHVGLNRAGARLKASG